MITVILTLILVSWLVMDHLTAMKELKAIRDSASVVYNGMGTKKLSKSD